MTDVLLVRHGRTEWNQVGRLQGHEDIPLDDVGTAQAAAAAQALAGEGWQQIVSSPLARALATAELIARACGLAAPVTEAAFVERSYGAASGMYDHEVRARWPDRRWPDGESRDDVYRRARPALDRLAAAAPDGRVIVVAHGGLIRSLVAGLEGRPDDERDGVVNLGASLLRSDGPDGWTVRYYNRSLAPSAPR